MNRRPHTTRRTPKATRLTPIAACGALLVAALVLALPLVLAFCPVDALSGGGGMSGVGAGTGDEIAAAVSSLDRELQDTARLPAPKRRYDAPGAELPFFAPELELGCGALTAAPPPACGSRMATPGDALVGLTDLGHQLLL